MHASECKRHADACSRLAEELPARHRAFVLDMAEKWLQAARDLEREERQRSAGDGAALSRGI